MQWWADDTGRRELPCSGGLAEDTGRRGPPCSGGLADNSVRSGFHAVVGR